MPTPVNQNTYLKCYVFATLFHIGKTLLHLQRCFKNDHKQDMEQIKRFIGFNADFAGSLAAMICAVHCMAFPLLLSFGLVSTTGHNHAFDFIFMAGGLLIAGYVLVKDYITKHRQTAPLLISVLGFVLLFFGIQSHGELFLLSISGGLMITFSHYQNWKLSHKH